MTNKQIFESSIFKLPISRNEDFRELMLRLYDEFLQKISEFQEPIKSKLTNKTAIIQFQISAINDTIDAYYRGFPGEAFNILASCLDRLKGEGILPIQEMNINHGQDEYYRARLDLQSNAPEQMFHIPFQLREIVGTQRYSIPGLPCLYLGDSIYICWEELGKPELTRMTVSRFDLNASQFKFLFLNDSYSDHYARCFQKLESGDARFVNGLIHYLSIFPLLAVSSIKVRYPNSVFKPEYIVPQLILQWIVQNEDLDGVKYRSNRVNDAEGTKGAFCNLVIPVKSVKPSGFCDILSNKIKLTEPLSYQISKINLNSSSIKLTTDQIAASLQRISTLELIKGNIWDYSLTEFGVLEERLRTFKTDYLL